MNDTNKWQGKKQRGRVPRSKCLSKEKKVSVKRNLTRDQETRNQLQEFRKGIR